MGYDGIQHWPKWKNDTYNEISHSNLQKLDLSETNFTHYFFTPKNTTKMLVFKRNKTGIERWRTPGGKLFRACKAAIKHAFMWANSHFDDKTNQI